ncbi:hypothetical protein OXX69_004140 [Metschnikowia pulcherrima]
MSTQSKVYISNLNYHTTEEELREYLADTKAANVFIPNHFVGFGSSRLKPLGIAYADLPTAEEAEEFIKAFDGKSFKDRKLKTKHHVPYIPSQKLSRLSSVNSIKRLSRNENREVKEENKENVSTAHARASVEKTFSENGVFVKGLKSKTCDEDLKTIFREFNPTEVTIFKPRGWMRGLKHRSHNAIVTLDLPKDKTVDDVVSTCNGEICCGNSLVVTRAFLRVERDADKLGDGGKDEPVHEANAPTEQNAKGIAGLGELPEEDSTEAGKVTEPPKISGSKDASHEPSERSYDQDHVSDKAIYGEVGSFKEAKSIAEAKAA